MFFVNFYSSPPSSPEPSLLECQKCSTTEDIIKITEEDICRYCQLSYENTYYCVPCYQSKMTKEVCISCRTMFPNTRTIPTNIVLRLEHPDEMQYRCSMCETRNEVVFQPMDHFCNSCLAKRVPRYICLCCYEFYRYHYAPCFYCSELIYANQDKLQYKNI